jgi:hypothetical protein
MQSISALSYCDSLCVCLAYADSMRVFSAGMQSFRHTNYNTADKKCASCSNVIVLLFFEQYNREVGHVFVDVDCMCIHLVRMHEELISA